ncbi:MAG TPA: PLP-dependent aminotransferase family protein [Candidatus Limnocylindrales bacterium]|nr:PLP-dependent aminotransferase family protein [Candidatus Limnocylindrales bacterium]
MDRASQVRVSRGAGELLLELELRRGRLRRSVREALREAIQDGRLRAGTRLPSSRRLAVDLGVSRGVVSDCYDQLVSEGYLEISGRTAPLVAAVVGVSPPMPETPPPSWRFDFIATTPDVSLFPRRAWARAVDRSLRTAADLALDYGDHRGQAALRHALSTYLARVRGVRIDPERIVVTQGFTQALDLLCRVLAGRGHGTIAIETPSLPDEWATVRQSNLRLVGCPVDGGGLRVDRLEALGADAVIVTPAHQFPTGAVLAPARRTALVGWAAQRGGLIIEDDYDAEFRYDRLATGAVQGLDPGRVAHVGTASKTLAPGCRIGWLSLPGDLVDDVKARKAAADSGSPAIDQLGFAELLTSGDYERHVTRVRHVYRGRRDRLVRALGRAMPNLETRGAAVGMHLLLALDRSVDDAAVVDAAAERGIRVRALSPLHLEPSPERGLLLGYGRLVEERIDEAVDALARVLRRVGVPT